ncbi:PIR protein [Plasmodium ovale]|uniref:PIR protein n=1 Tax=Plasmodium ovale TaxID=36330 RepID=A0A1D3KWK0_PLAOA|nr:PIR protein [Plasmodium ovale]
MDYIGIKDFPSKQCYENFKNAIKYEEIMRNIKRKNLQNVTKWVEAFKVNLLGYIKNYMNKWEDKYCSKCCRDLNHILDIIIEEILKSNLQNKILLYNKTETAAKSLLNDVSSSKCHRELYDDAYRFRHLKKKFFDFCEDSSYVSSNFEKIKTGPKCKPVMFNIRSRRKELKELFNRLKSLPRDEFHFSEQCNIDSISNILKTTNCITVPQVEALSGRDPAAAIAGDLELPKSREDSEEVLDPDSSEASDLVEREIQEYESSEHLNITYAASSVFGTALFSYFLYRATPVGSWLRSKVLPNAQNNFDMYNDGSSNILSNSIDPLQLNLENYEYNMPYAAGGL